MTTLNERAYELANAMVADADELGVSVSTLECGTRIIDCGVKAPGSIEAGRRLAEVCMAGLGNVTIIPEKGIQNEHGTFDLSNLYAGLGTKFVGVITDQPVAACMASQYAGWQITGEKFFAMGSGPMRAAACREKLFQAICHCEKSDVCIGVLETSKIPPDAVCIDLAEKCGINPESLTLLIARTSSPAGTVQIVARSVETALHKLHELGFDLAKVESGLGWAPLPPVAGDDNTAIGWTNDAILYGGLVRLQITADESTVGDLGPRVPSNASPDYGRPFAEIFARYGGDFYKIDPMLFSPAEIRFGLADDEKDKDFRFPANIWLGYRPGTRKELQFGKLAPAILAESFGAKK